VTYGLNLNMLQMMLIWNLCQLENKIISVERLFQYTCIPSEPPLAIEENQPDHSWPSDGEVDIRDLQVSFSCLSPNKIILCIGSFMAMIFVRCILIDADGAM
jgi:hypothetical protein